MLKISLFVKMAGGRLPALRKQIKSEFFQHSAWDCFFKKSNLTLRRVTKTLLTTRTNGWKLASTMLLE